MASVFRPTPERLVLARGLDLLEDPVEAVDDADDDRQADDRAHEATAGGGPGGLAALVLRLAEVQRRALTVRREGGGREEEQAEDGRSRRVEGRGIRITEGASLDRTRPLDRPRLRAPLVATSRRGARPAGRARMNTERPGDEDDDRPPVQVRTSPSGAADAACERRRQCRVARQVLVDQAEQRREDQEPDRARRRRRPPGCGRARRRRRRAPRVSAAAIRPPPTIIARSPSPARSGPSAASAAAGGRAPSATTTIATRDGERREHVGEQPRERQAEAVGSDQHGRRDRAVAVLAGRADDPEEQQRDRQRRRRH